MHLRFTSTVVGAAAFLALGATVARAQDTTKAHPRSQRHIPVSKEAPGEVARVDTVTVYHTDTLTTTNTVTHYDTIATTNTVTHYDTVQLAAPSVVRHLPNGLYFGLGAGMSLPEGSLYVPNAPGGTAQAQIGWQGARSLLGLRADMNYTQPGEDSFYSGYQADPDILNFNGDLKVQAPWFHHIFGSGPSFTVYGIGGASYVMWKDLPMVLSPAFATTTPPAGVLVGDTDWNHHWGWNAGGGVAFGWNRTELFIESRAITFDTPVSPKATQVPITIGLNWY
jgi:hypothetical protein